MQVDLYSVHKTMYLNTLSLSFLYLNLQGLLDSHSYLQMHVQATSELILLDF